MCDRITNLPRAVRNRVDLPCGNFVSFAEIETRFSEVPRELRGQLSKRLLQGITDEDRKRLRNWAAVRVKKDNIPDSMLHLMVFYVIAFVAKVPQMLEDTLNAILGKGTIVGTIVPA